MAKYIVPIEFVLEAPNDADAMAHGTELAKLLYQQHAVDYYLMGQPRSIQAPETPPRAPAPAAAPAPQPAAAPARRR